MNLISGCIGYVNWLLQLNKIIKHLEKSDDVYERHCALMRFLKTQMYMGGHSSLGIR